jgi:serine/threonine protein kinase
LKHLRADDINFQVLQMLWEDRFKEYIPYKLFSKWSDVDDVVFKDFIRGLATLDFAKRVTARQALEHPWLADF